MLIIDKNDKSFFKHKFTLLCKRSELESVITWLLKEHRKFLESFDFSFS